MAPAAALALALAEEVVIKLLIVLMSVLAAVAEEAVKAVFMGLILLIPLQFLVVAEEVAVLAGIAGQLLAEEAVTLKEEAQLPLLVQTMALAEEAERVIKQMLEGQDQLEEVMAAAAIQVAQVQAEQAEVEQVGQAA
jgi:hypothetical protein